MARLRTIKPGFFVNETLAEVPPLGRILFQGLWCISDREGRLEDRPRKIKAEVLPYDDADVDDLLTQLHAKGFILRYEVKGTRYISVVNFRKHQYPHVKEAPSIIPAPDEHDASMMQAPDEHDANTILAPSVNLLICESVNPGNGLLVDAVAANGTISPISPTHAHVREPDAAAASWPENVLAQTAERIGRHLTLPASKLPSLTVNLRQFPPAYAAYLEAEAVNCAEFYSRKKRPVDVRLFSNWLHESEKRRMARPTEEGNNHHGSHETTQQQPRTVERGPDAGATQAESDEQYRTKLLASVDALVAKYQPRSANPMPEVPGKHEPGDV